MLSLSKVENEKTRKRQKKQPSRPHNECGRACVMSYTTETRKQKSQRETKSNFVYARVVNGETGGGVG